MTVFFGKVKNFVHTPLSEVILSNLQREDFSHESEDRHGYPFLIIGSQVCLMESQ